MTNQYAVIPSDPASKKKILAAMQEISDAMTRIEAEKSYIKESISVISEEFAIKKPILNKLARFYHKDDVQDVKDKTDEVFEAFELLTGKAID